MTRIPYFLFTLASVLPMIVIGQQQLDVEAAVDLALTRNLELKTQKLSTANTLANVQQSKEAFLPNVNASIDYRWQFGTVFDPLNFQRVNDATSFSAPSLTANWDVFRGFSRWYTYKRFQKDLEANQFGEERVENQVLTTLLQQYLQLVLNERALEVSATRKSLLENQRKRTKVLLDAGSATEVQYKNVSAQVALEEVNVINAKNNIARDKLQIRQTLQITDPASYAIVTPEAPAESMLKENVPALQPILAYALVNMPEVREQQAGIEAAQLASKVAKSGYYPTVSLTGALSSNYTSNGGVPVYDTVEVVPGLEFPQVVDRERTDFFPQISDNFSQFAGVTVRIPIYNNGQVRRNIQQAEIGEMQADIGLKQVQMALRQTIESTHLDAKAAYQTLQALQVQKDAATAAYELAEVQYQNGALNFFDYLEALNTKTQAEVQYIQTAYRYLFTRKLLDFYAGRPLNF